jgi:hypothetical protein
MSYSLDKPCSKCKLEGGCLDAEMIQGAISTIHQLNNYVSWPNTPRDFMAHKGGGSITINCSNFQPKEE